MKIFITGGTGFIGNRLAEKLVNENHDVVFLIRDKRNTGYITHKRITFVEGTLFDKDVLKRGMKDCDLVFHLAAYTKPWSKDPSMSYRVNVTGTINIFNAARENNIRKVVFTSTAGTMSYSKDGNPVDELTNPDPEYHTIYEKTKAEAERIAVDYCQKGLDVVIVNPTRVYGPGRLSKSNSLTKIISLYIRGLWRILPGNGKSAGNYVFIDDVVKGHILAASFGRKGERYILGGENLTFRELLGIIGESAGKTRRVFTLPLSVIKIVIRLVNLTAKISGIPPFITMEWLDKYMNDWIMSSEKAVKELNYNITSFGEGVNATINWLKTKNTRDD